MKNYGSWVADDTSKAPSEDFKKEKRLRGDAVQAGYDKASAYDRAVKQYDKFMREGMQSVAQLTPRMLQGASSFNAPGGASIVAAEAVAPTIAAAQSQLGLTGTDRIVGAEVGGADARTDAALFDISALDSVVAQRKALGYMDLYQNYRQMYDDEQAASMLAHDLRWEQDPAVKIAVGRQIQTAVSMA
jgi:hypothetical protein